MTATCHNPSCPISLFEHTEGHGECVPAYTELMSPDREPTPADRLFVTASGQVWIEDHINGGWKWLRLEFYGAGPTFEGGYRAPLEPVRPLRGGS